MTLIVLVYREMFTHHKISKLLLESHTLFGDVQISNIATSGLGLG